jgi:sulfite exporter TauE/SafE
MRTLDMALSLLISAWLVGALGGVHCLTMCGGFVTAVATRDAAAGGVTVALLPARTVASRQLVYHAGRITTYTLLGAAFGAAGATALDAVALLPLQRTLYVGANLFLLLLAAGVAFRRPGVAWLQHAGAKAFGAVLPAVRPLLERNGVAARLALGLVWGLVPCALVYSVLPLALFAGGAWQGAAVLLAFGAGTLPNLVAAGVVLHRAGQSKHSAALRYVAAALLAGFAIVGIYRVLWVPAAMAQGPFCLIP